MLVESFIQTLCVHTNMDEDWRRKKTLTLAYTEYLHRERQNRNENFRSIKLSTQTRKHIRRELQVGHIIRA